MRAGVFSFLVLALAALLAFNTVAAADSERELSVGVASAPCSRYLSSTRPAARARLVAFMARVALSLSDYRESS